jgi:hypothetical protein
MSTVEFNQILLRNADFLRPFAITLTRDQETAKDLMQETLFRALANRKNIMSAQISRHGSTPSCEIFSSTTIAGEQNRTPSLIIPAMIFAKLQSAYRRKWR